MPINISKLAPANQKFIDNKKLPEKAAFLQVIMKRFISEKYADILLQLCADFKNRYPEEEGPLSQAVNRALETLDKYSFYILGMGYMLYESDIPLLKEYLNGLKGRGSAFSDCIIDDVLNYLTETENRW